MTTDATDDNLSCDGLGGIKESCVSNDGRGLTDTSSAINVDSDEDTGAAEMTDDPRLEQALSLIRAVIADADKRAADEIVARISGTRPAVLPLGDSPDKRAPRGSAGTLIDRALDAAGDDGLTVFGIQSKAETSFEKMVTTSAIRNWLKEGERKHRYRQVGGVWFLAGHGPSMKVVG
jgi:hypothetical protein